VPGVGSRTVADEYHDTVAMHSPHNGSGLAAGAAEAGAGAGAGAASARNDPRDYPSPFIATSQHRSTATSREGPPLRVEAETLASRRSSQAGRARQRPVVSR
jgi:hypothetical protein